MVANCDPDKNGVCQVCGASVRPGTKRNCSKPRVPIGDWVAAGLKVIGVTPERVERLTGKPCGCKKRQESMNRWL